MVTPHSPADDTPERRAHRVAALRETHEAKLDKVFRGRVFTVVREIHLPAGQVFRTVLGEQARHGYVLVDRVTGERIAVGAKTLRIIHDRYLGVNLPPDRRRTRLIRVR